MSAYVVLSVAVVSCIFLLIFINIYRINLLNNKKFNMLDMQEFIHLSDDYKNMYKQVVVDRLMPIFSEFSNNSMRNVLKYYNKNEEILLAILDNWINIMKIEQKKNLKKNVSKLNKEHKLILNQLNLNEVLTQSCNILEQRKRLNNVNDTKIECSQYT